MQHCLAHAAKAGFRSVRLCNVVANVTAFSLYHSLGFGASDYMMHIKGRIAPQHQQRLAADMQAAAVTVRPMAESDIADCDRLQLATTAYSRYHSILHSFRSQLSQRLLTAAQQLEDKTAQPGSGEPQHTCFVAVDGQQRLLGYTDGYDLDCHTVAIEEAVVSWLYARLCTELEAAGTRHGESTEGGAGSPDLHVLTQRYPALLNRMLALGCRSVRQICIMTHGEYVAPRRHVYCFPERDTRVLTNHGLLFLGEIEALQQAGEDVLFGCYDVQSKALLYSTGRLVFPQRPPPCLVEFTSAGEAAPWAEGGGDYRTKGAPEDKPSSGHVSLRVTPEHSMFVQRDRSSDSPYAKVQAQALLPTAGAGDQFRMLACAQAGHAPQATRQRQAVQRDLHLDDTQFAAFIELLGFWLGQGSMACSPAVNGSAAGCVCFSQVKQADLSWLRSTLKQAGLKEDEYWLTGSSGSVTTLGVSESAWLAFFDKEFGGESVKHLPDWALQELPAAEMRLLISGLHRADGSFAAGENAIDTSTAHFRDQLVQALLHCGYSAYAGLMYGKGAIRGYVWKVSWAEVIDGRRDSSAGSSCWPSMSRHQCVTKVPYDAERDGRIWCVEVEHADHLIMAQRAQRDDDGTVTKQSQPIVVGNCPSIMW